MTAGRKKKLKMVLASVVVLENKEEEKCVNNSFFSLSEPNIHRSIYAIYIAIIIIKAIFPYLQTTIHIGFWGPFYWISSSSSQSQGIYSIVRIILVSYVSYALINGSISLCSKGVCLKPTLINSSWTSLNSIF